MTGIEKAKSIALAILNNEPRNGCAVNALAASGLLKTSAERRLLDEMMDECWAVRGSLSDNLRNAVTALRAEREAAKPKPRWKANGYWLVDTTNGNEWLGRDSGITIEQVRSFANWLNGGSLGEKT